MNTVMKRTPFTHKQCIHREFRRKVKGMKKLVLCSYAFRSLKLCFFKLKTTYIYNQRKRFHIPIKYRIKSSQVCELHILQLAFTFSTKLIKRQLKAKIPYFRIRFQPPSLFQQAITKNRRILKLYDYCADSTNTTRFRIG